MSPAPKTFVRIGYFLGWFPFGLWLLFEGSPNHPFAAYLIIIWEFPKIRGTLFCGRYNKDPTI